MTTKHRYSAHVAAILGCLAWWFHAEALALVVNAPAAVTTAGATAAPGTTDPASVSQAPRAEIKRVALLVGISHYASYRDLEGPREDVRAMREVLQNVWGFEAEDIVTVTDGEATRERILRELDTLYRRTAPGDHVLIYYSGHGTSSNDLSGVVPLPDDTGALVPTDFSIDGSTQALLDRLILGRRDLRPRLQRLDQGDRWVAVFVDSCFAESVLRSAPRRFQLPGRYLALPGNTLRGEGRGRQIVSTGATTPTAYSYDQTVFIAAASAFEEATDIGSAMLSVFPTFDLRPHGAFTDALLRFLSLQRSPDLDRNGAVTYRELYKAVRDFMSDRGYRHVPQRRPSTTQKAAAVSDREVFESTRRIEPVGPNRNLPALSVLLTGPDTIVAPLRDAISATPGLVLRQSPPSDLVGVVQGPLVQLWKGGGILLDQVLIETPEALAERLLRHAWALSVIGNSTASPEIAVDLAMLPDRGFASPGDELRMSVHVNVEAPAAVAVLNIDPQGNVNVLFPKTLRDLRRRIVRDLPLRLPDHLDGFAFDVSPPFGTEHLVALAFADAPPVLEALVGLDTVAFSSTQRDLIDALVRAADDNGAKTSLRVQTLDLFSGAP